jgi:hypothetical protein
MGNEEKSGLFRKKALDNISSPEDLNSYLKVTNPSVWIILVAVIVLLAGLFVWSMVGTLETKADAVVNVENNQAKLAITSQGGTDLKPNMVFRIDTSDYYIYYVESDEYGRTIGYSKVDLPNNVYVAEVVLEQTYPIEFLMESR